MEQHKWSVEFTWIKAHAGHPGNEKADQLAKEAANKNIEASYTKIPKNAILNELKEKSTKQWQSEWENTTKGATTKLFFPKVEYRFKIRINTAPKFTTITRHGNIKSYLYKCKMITRSVSVKMVTKRCNT